jgi:hypothetical protein
LPIVHACRRLPPACRAERVATLHLV